MRRVTLVRLDCYRTGLSCLFLFPHAHFLTPPPPIMLWCSLPQVAAMSWTSQPQPQSHAKPYLFSHITSYLSGSNDGTQVLSIHGDEFPPHQWMPETRAEPDLMYETFHIMSPSLIGSTAPLPLWVAFIFISKRQNMAPLPPFFPFSSSLSPLSPFL